MYLSILQVTLACQKQKRPYPFHSLVNMGFQSRQCNAWESNPLTIQTTVFLDCSCLEIKCPCSLQYSPKQGNLENTSPNVVIDMYCLILLKWLPSSKLTWQLNIPIINQNNYIFKRSIFHCYVSLVGGFNPFETYARQIGSFPQVSGWHYQTGLWNHHLDDYKIR